VAKPTEPEVPTMMPGKRRKFPLEVRRQIVEYYDALSNDGSKGAYLRRYGLFDASITQWRKQIASQAPATKPGRKPLTADQKELRRLREQNARLQSDLERANAVIEVQKKVSALLEMESIVTEQRAERHREICSSRT
jgi:transposase